jgi:hypothetical protein
MPPASPADPAVRVRFYASIPIFAAGCTVADYQLG